MNDTGNGKRRFNMIRSIRPWYGILRRAILIIEVCLIAGLVESAVGQQPLLSPRDSVELKYNGNKKITVNYGRPSMRGRKIMGGLVPYNKWWRTGANEATSFVTELDLVLGGEEIPRGSYTLYTMPSEKQWKLIINRQTGQWGTVYNPDLDLKRILLKKKTLKTPVEKFTITLEKNGNGGGIMKLVWENTELSIAFKIRKNSKSSTH
jgi:hypothetical protein